MSGDRPIFARAKYLVIMELTIATLFARVLVTRHQMSCCQFFYFSSGLTCGLLKTIEPPSSFVANSPSAVPVIFHNYNDSATSVARRLQVPTMRSRDILLQAKGDHLDRVHSDQMVLKMIRQGRLVR